MKTIESVGMGKKRQYLSGRQFFRIRSKRISDFLLIIWFYNCLN
jgi:hypothetical protein